MKTTRALAILLFLGTSQAQPPTAAKLSDADWRAVRTELGRIELLFRRANSRVIQFRVHRVQARPEIPLALILRQQYLWPSRARSCLSDLPPAQLLHRRNLTRQSKPPRLRPSDRRQRQ